MHEGDKLSVLVEDIDSQGKISLKPIGEEWAIPQGQADESGGDRRPREGSRDRDRDRGRGGDRGDRRGGRRFRDERGSRDPSASKAAPSSSGPEAPGGE